MTDPPDGTPPDGTPAPPSVEDDMPSTAALTLANGAMTLEPAPRSSFTFTRQGAERLTAEIRLHLRVGLEKLTLAREGLAWQAMGYPTWHDYCEAEFGDLRELAIPATERRYLVASMKETALSNRPIAERLGCSVGTVSTDLALLRKEGWAGEPEQVVSADGSLRSARSLRAVPEAPNYAGMSRMSESAARVAQQQERGLTSLELDHETGWPMGTASGNLSKLARRGWIRETDTFRGHRAAYVITEVGLAGLAEVRSRLEDLR